MDEDGNSNFEPAYEYVMSLRKPVIEHAKDVNTIDRYIAEQAVTPREACWILSGNIFPKKELIDHLNNIRTHSKLQGHKQVGDLV